jgi:hypothetical protein
MEFNEININNYRSVLDSKPDSFWIDNLRNLRPFDWETSDYLFKNGKFGRMKLLMGETSISNALDEWSIYVRKQSKDGQLGFRNIKFNRDDWYRKIVHKWNLFEDHGKRSKTNEWAYLCIDVFFKKYPPRGQYIKDAIAKYVYNPEESYKDAIAKYVYNPEESYKEELSEMLEKYYEPLAIIQDQILDWYGFDEEEHKKYKGKDIILLNNEYEKLEKSALNIHERVRDLIDEEKDRLLDSLPGSQTAHGMFSMLDTIYLKNIKIIEYEGSFHVKKEVVSALNEMLYFLHASIRQELDDDALGEIDNIQDQFNFILNLMKKNNEFLKNYYKEFGADSKASIEEKEDKKLSLEDF